MHGWLLSLDGHTVPRRWRTDTGLLVLCGIRPCALRVICSGSLLQETGLLGRTSTLETDRARMATDAASGDLLSLGTGATTIAGGSGVVGTGWGGSKVRDVLGNGVLWTNVGDTDIWGFAGLAEGVVSRIEIFPFLNGKSRSTSVCEERTGGNRSRNPYTFNLFWRRSFLFGILP